MYNIEEELGERLIEAGREPIGSGLAAPSWPGRGLMFDLARRSDRSLSKPVYWMSPTTWSAEDGAVVPMPTLP
jgi:hypothetical protein